MSPAFSAVAVATSMLKLRQTATKDFKMGFSKLQTRTAPDRHTQEARYSPDNGAAVFARKERHVIFGARFWPIGEATQTFSGPVSQSGATHVNLCCFPRRTSGFKPKKRFQFPRFKTTKSGGEKLWRHEKSYYLLSFFKQLDLIMTVSSFAKRIKRIISVPDFSQWQR